MTQSNFDGTNYQVQTGDKNTNFFGGEHHHHYPQPPIPIEPKHFTVPYSRNTYFTGREAILTQLHETLGQSGTAALSQAKAISGLGGVGKTQTAVEYAHRYFYDQSFYDWVLWVNASNLTLTSSFASIATDLALPNHQENKLDENIAAVKRWLTTTDRWLLIFDNVDDPKAVKPFRPNNPQGRILITSRIQRLESLGVGRSIELTEMTAAEAHEFLQRRAGLVECPLNPPILEDFEETGSPDSTQIGKPKGSVPHRIGGLGGQSPTIDPTEQQALEDVAVTLGYLPLALEQAAAYILAKGVSFAAYLRSYQKRRLQLLEKEKPQTGDYPESVATTWTINFEEVQSNSPAAADLLRLSAFLAPDNIPYEILWLGKDHLGELLSAALTEAAEDELVLPELLEELTRYSLIRLETDYRYSIHRMVQEVLRDILTPEQRQQWIDCTVNALNATFPSPEFKNWWKIDRLIEHVQAIDLQQATGTSGLALLLNEAGYFLHEKGQYAEAEILYKKSLYVRKTFRGESHPDVALSLNNLAALYKYQGQYKLAESYYQQAIQVYTNLGVIDHNLATSLDNLANLYCSQRQLELAEPLYLQALQIYKDLFGENHPDVAICLNNLATLHCLQKRYENADLFYQQSLQLTRSFWGEIHPYVATSLDNLASLYRRAKRYREAEITGQKALQMYKDLLGENHPDVAICLSNLATLYGEQKQYSAAEPLYLQSLVILIEKFGEQHRQVQTVLNDFVDLLQQAIKVGKTDQLSDHPLTQDLLMQLTVEHKSSFFSD